METKSNAIVLDSSAIISLLSETDSNHEPAQNAIENIPDTVTALLLPDAIFFEHIDTIGKKQGHSKAIAAAKWILGNELIVTVDTTRFREKILELYSTQPQGVSLADCSVMVTADEYDTK